MKKPVLVIATLALVLGGGGCAFLQHPKFGPSTGDMQSEKVLASPNYVDGEFRNQIDTPLFTEDVSFLGMVWRNLTEAKPDNLRPQSPLPSEKIDLKALDADRDIVVWLGHSSFYVQLDGRSILIDPVFATYAAPVPYTNKAFDGTTPYLAEDMPEIDYLLITHEHWDHLDYEAVVALRPKTRHAVGSLGLAAYFRLWGFDENQIHELDWNESLTLDPGATLHALPARHYSRRLFASNQALWVGFALISDDKRLFFSGDSGYGPHFAEIGERFGSFDLAALDAGQYNPTWAYIHMTPSEAAQAAEDLGAKALLPIHVGKFALSDHAWDTPFSEITDISQDRNYQLMTPLIGEPIDLDAAGQSFTRWWDNQ